MHHNPLHPNLYYAGGGSKAISQDTTLGSMVEINSEASTPQPPQHILFDNLKYRGFYIGDGILPKDIDKNLFGPKDRVFASSGGENSNVTIRIEGVSTSFLVAFLWIQCFIPA
jgi:hypothetical protein